MNIAQKQIIKEELNDKEYYMSEGCTYLAIALHRKFGYQIVLIKGDRAKYPHVFVKSPKQGYGIDALGERPISQIIDYYHDVYNKRAVEISEDDLIDNYMGEDDEEYPFYAYSEKEMKDAEEFIEKILLNKKAS